MVAFIDLPFMFLFLGVIYSITGPCNCSNFNSSTCFGCFRNYSADFRRFTDKNLKNQQGKMIVLRINNVETVGAAEAF